MAFNMACVFCHWTINVEVSVDNNLCGHWVSVRSSCLILYAVDVGQPVQSNVVARVSALGSAAEVDLLQCRTLTSLACCHHSCHWYWSKRMHKLCYY